MLGNILGKFINWCKNNATKLVGFAILAVGLIIGLIVVNGVISSQNNAQDINEVRRIIDVRTFEQFNISHVDKAINIDYTSGGFNNYLKQLDPEMSYIIYGENKEQSTDAYNVFKKEGFKYLTNGVNMNETSKLTGLPIVDGSIQTQISTPTPTPTISPTSTPVSGTPVQGSNPTPTATFTPIIVPTNMPPTASPTPTQ